MANMGRLLGALLLCLLPSLVMAQGPVSPPGIPRNLLGQPNGVPPTDSTNHIPPSFIVMPNPTFIPKLPMVLPPTSSTIITHANSGMIMVYGAPSGQTNTWTFQANMTVGDDVCFYNAGQGTLVFAAASGVTIKAGPGITPGLTTQYQRQCAFSDGVNWVFY